MAIVFGELALLHICDWNTLILNFPLEAEVILKIIDILINFHYVLPKVILLVNSLNSEVTDTRAIVALTAWKWLNVT